MDDKAMAQTRKSAVVIAVLAAGASSRMRGGDKLLERVGDEAVLRRQARLAADTGAPVIVAVPVDRPDRIAALDGLAVTIVMVPDAHLGMSWSLRAALQAARAMDLGSASGFMVLPADMPEFTTDGLRAVIETYASHPECIVRGTASDGQPGHPAIFPPDLWDALEAMTGDQGGKAVIAAHPARVRLALLPGAMAITDLDTPEDWADWRAMSAD